MNKLLILFLCFFTSANSLADPKIAILDFELKDLTMLPNTPAEVTRTASVKPMLETELKNMGLEIVAIPIEAQKQANLGQGYLFDHDDTAAQLGQKFQADYVLVGRLHKPSFLFVYLMGHLIDVEQQKMAAEFMSEVKGGDPKLTGKGVEDLARKISKALH